MFQSNLFNPHSTIWIVYIVGMAIVSVLVKIFDGPTPSELQAKRAPIEYQRWKETFTPPNWQHDSRYFLAHMSIQNGTSFSSYFTKPIKLPKGKCFRYSHNFGRRIEPFVNLGNENWQGARKTWKVFIRTTGAQQDTQLRFRVRGKSGWVLVGFFPYDHWNCKRIFNREGVAYRFTDGLVKMHAKQVPRVKPKPDALDKILATKPGMDRVQAIVDAYTKRPKKSKQIATKRIETPKPRPRQKPLNLTNQYRAPKEIEQTYLINNRGVCRSRYRCFAEWDDGRIVSDVSCLTGTQHAYVEALSYVFLCDVCTNSSIRNARKTLTRHCRKNRRSVRSIKKYPRSDR